MKDLKKVKEKVKDLKKVKKSERFEEQSAQQLCVLSLRPAAQSRHDSDSAVFLIHFEWQKKCHPMTSEKPN